MELKEGKFTIETFAKERGISIQSAINLLSKLKKQGFVLVSGGGKQQRIYTIANTKQEQTNGFYDIINKYSPEKLNSSFKHYTHGNYTVEHAIIDGIRIGDYRTLQATKHLFRHVKNWKRLFDLAKSKNLTREVLELYEEARHEIKCRKMPKRYKL